MLKKPVCSKLLLTRGSILFLCWLLAGCGCFNFLNNNGMTADAAPKLPTKVAGSSDARKVQLMADLDKKGVKVITIGQTYMVSIPSSRIFADQSPRIPWDSYALLNEVVEFMQQYRKIAVNVTSYSSKYVSAKRERALTLARAKAVSNYLWDQGIDSRFIFSEGAGSDKPVVSYYKGGDMSPNSRIEITFRDAVA